MKTYVITLLCLILFTGVAGAESPATGQNNSITVPSFDTIESHNALSRGTEVSVTGQSGSINVPSAFITKGRANIAVYDAYASQNNFLGQGNKLENNTVYGALSYAPLQYLEISLGSLDSSSIVTSSQSLHYSGDLKIGIKGSYEVIPDLSIGILTEALLYSKVGAIGYNGNAASYTLSLLASYDMSKSKLSFPLIATLRIGYLWDNTQNLLSSTDNNLIPPLGKYAMGIRGDGLTLLGISLLFPLPEYYIEPMLEFTSQFTDSYSSYSLTDPSFSSVSWNQNPLYITPGILFYTPVRGLRIAIAAELSVSKKVSDRVTTGSFSTAPQVIWIGGLSYSFSE